MTFVFLYLKSDFFFNLKKKRTPWNLDIKLSSRSVVIWKVLKIKDNLSRRSYLKINLKTRGISKEEILALLMGEDTDKERAP